MAEPQLGAVPFTESIDFLRGKLDLPTRWWDDYLGEVHAHAFTVAGATSLDVVGGLHKAVTAAIENGETITDFRKRFDAVVEETGWSYRGDRGWRTRVIYDNNLRTAHQAGHWQQMQATKESHPYGLYLTVDDADVREEHQRWHYILLPLDHTWWDTHYPPNGWGCRCTVIAVSEADIESLGLTITENPPPLNRTERVNSRSGEIYPETPEGIDVGWDYNVGKALDNGSLRALSTKLAVAESPLAVAALQRWMRSPGFKRWLAQPDADVTVAILDDVVQAAIGANVQLAVLSRDTMAKQRDNHPELTADDYARIPDIVANGEARQDGERSVVFFRTVPPGQLVVVKATRSGNNVFVTSVRRASAQEIRRQRRRGKRLRQEREV